MLRVPGSRDARLLVTVLVWVPAALLVDRTATLLEQRALGLLTWLLLLALLRGESALVRVQTLVVVVFATAVEYASSDGLGIYVYRLDNVPWFVPPGHGLVYLVAFAFGRSAFARRHARVLVGGTVAVGGAYAIWGLSPLAPRADVLGAFWFLCLLGFLVFGRSRLLYVGAFMVVTYVELLGTAIGTWTWQAHDFTGLVPMGNPPSGAAGGYGWFDLVAVSAAPWLLARFAERRDDERGTSEEPSATMGTAPSVGQQPEHLVMDVPIGRQEVAALERG